MVKLESKKLESILYFIIGVFLVLIVNQLSSIFFYRFDLTEEKRYSISQSSKNILTHLEEVVYVDVYLEGKLPSGVRRLQRSIRETLDEFQVYAGRNLQYRFVNPASAKSDKARQDFFQRLINIGIQPTNLYDNIDGKRTQTLIFPGAVLSYGANEQTINFLKGNKASSPQEQLNQSIEGIEYELSNAIKSITEPRTKRIALLKGHGELDTLQVAGLTAELMNKYKVFHVDLRKRSDLLGFDAIVLAKPTEPFSEFDKYKIDQFIMRGGKAMFLIDGLNASMDNADAENNLALPLESNLEDLFFNMGFRINNDLVLDMSAARYPVVVGNLGDNPQISLLPWPFFPVVNDFTKHPAVRNMDAVRTRFISSIDTVKVEGIIKQPLMRTSNYSKVLNAPVSIQVDELRKEMKPEFFNSGPQVIGWMMEGAFESLFKNRFLPAGADKSTFIEEGTETKIMIVSDGDIALSDVNPKTGQPTELGYDPFTETRFANADLLLNTMTYLVEDDGIINTRLKEVRIRPLDQVKIDKHRLTIQLVNIVLPILLLLAYGVLKYTIRKQKYATAKS